LYEFYAAHSSLIEIDFNVSGEFPALQIVEKFNQLFHHCRAYTPAREKCK